VPLENGDKARKELRSRVLLEKPVTIYQVEEFPGHYGIHRLIAMVPRVRSENLR
jgi:hypothetical protein